MTRARRRRAKRGRHLAARPASELLEAFPDIKEESERLLAIGFRLAPSIRPYLRTDGRVTIVFLWLRRERQHGETTTVRHVVRIGFESARPWAS